MDSTMPKWRWILHDIRRFLPNLIYKKRQQWFGCWHPKDAIMWNPYNKVVQCHACGQVFNDSPIYLSDKD